MKMTETGYSIYDNNKKFWFDIDRMVRGMDVVTVVEPAYNYQSATRFPTRESAERIIDQIDKEGVYDVNNACIIDIEQHVKELEAKQKAEEQKMIKEAWENTDEITKKNIISKAVQAGNIESLKEFLDDKGVDTSDIAIEEPKQLTEDDQLRAVASFYGIDISQADWKDKLKEKINQI